MYRSQPLGWLWFRVPKAGSTSFMEALGAKAQWKPTGVDHSMLRDYDMSQDDKEGFKTVITIRNPYDWLESFYSTCASAKPHWDEWVVSKGERNLEAFFENLKITQLDWGSDKDGNLIVDEVLRIEDLEELCASLDLPKPQTRNETDLKKRKTIDWTEERRVWVKDRFARELKFYPELS